MLVDIDFKSLRKNPIVELLEGPEGPERVAKGVYLAGWNFGNTLKHNGMNISEYPFRPFGSWPDFDMETEEGREANRKYLSDMMSGPDDYGVCDNWEQITAKWPEIEDNHCLYVISLAEVRKADQPEWGGWRWHKWGDYIGTKTPEHEHLYDEGPDIESVFTFHIYEILPLSE